MSEKGTGHWKAMRLTSVALIPLCLWLLFSVLSLVGASQLQWREFLADPLNGGMMLAFMLVGLHHSAYGLQEPVEDYVHNKSVRKALVLLIHIAHLSAAALVLWALFNLGFKA